MTDDGAPRAPRALLLREAWRQADDLCRAAGVTVETPQSPVQVAHAVAVLREIWGEPDALSATAMRALQHVGGYVVVVHELSDPEVVVGASAAFFAAPRHRRLHSHVTGVRTDRRGAHVGTALKLHQRAWALERDLGTISWTFDPLVGRNAHLNLTRLGARVEAYLPDFYGATGDRVNADGPTDRFEVVWDITRPWAPGAAAVPPPGTPVALAVSPDGAPLVRAVPSGAARVLVAVPRDIEALRTRQPALAQDWRAALHATLVPLFANGLAVTGLTADGHYVMEGPR